MANIYLLQTAIADYRDKFVFEVSKKLGGNFYILCGDRYFESSTKTSDFVLKQQNRIQVKNLFLFNNKICIQFIPIADLIRADIVYLELNPRLISNWAILLIRRFLNKSTILWGHVWSREGANSKTEALRNVMRRLSDRVLYYTETQKAEYVNKYPQQHVNKVYVAPNALYQISDMRVSNKQGNNFIYVGRLVESKKTDLLITAFAKLAKDASCTANLDIVGDGPEKSKLESLARTLSISDRVKFHGHISDLNKLYYLYGNAICSVSPGYVGLSITQSFSFGIPMIISKEENHSPEIEAFKVGENGSYFDSNSVESLCNKMKEFYSKREHWFNKRNDICSSCKATYSVEAMANGFISAGSVL